MKFKIKNSLLAVFFLFTFLSLIIFWPIFWGKVNLNGNLLVSFYAPYGQNLPFKPTGLDQIRIYFPFYKITLENLKNFKIPHWNLYAFSGHPHLADFQTAVFYPLNVAGFFLGQIEFWHLLRITPSILAAFFTFLYLEALGISSLAAIFGALTFGFSPFILTWGEEVVMSAHSIVWLPLILWAIERYLKKQRKIFLAVLAFAWAFSLFGGYIQTSIYLFIFVIAYLIFKVWYLKNGYFRGVKAHFGGVMAIVGSLALGTLIAAIQLLPSGELYFNSARSSVTLRETLFEFLLPIKSLLTFLAPDFFGHPATWNFFRGGSAQYYEGILFIGVAALVFATSAIVSERKNRLVMFLAIFGLVATSTTFDLPTSRLLLSLPIPFLSSSIANRVLFIGAFCMATIAAFGFEKWLIMKDKKILKVVICFGFLYSVFIFYLLGARYFSLPYFKAAVGLQAATISLRNLIIPTAVFGVTGLLVFGGSLKQEFKIWAARLILIVAFVHLFYFSQKYFSFTDRANVFPNQPVLDFIEKHQGYFRSWAVGDVIFENNFASLYAIFWPEGYDSLNNRSYGEFTHWMQGNKIEEYTFRADAGLGRVSTAEALENSNRRVLMDMVGVKYVIAKVGDSQILEKHNFKRVFKDEEFAVFENQQALPRVFLASNYEGPPDVEVIGKDEEEIKKERRMLIPTKLLSETFDWRNVLILEKPSLISPQFGFGQAEILSYEPNEVLVKTKSSQPKLLFLTDNYYPGWKVQVDGESEKIWRADYTFRAVPLLAGEHLVRFYYDSWVFKTGVIATLTSFGALVVLTLRKNRFLG